LVDPWRRHFARGELFHGVATGREEECLRVCLLESPPQAKVPLIRSILFRSCVCDQLLNKGILTLYKGFISPAKPLSGLYFYFYPLFVA
jgi:hypothetical protein